MLKRTVSLILVVAFLLVLCSCGGKSSDISDAMHRIGVNAIKAADDYIDGTLTEEGAYRKISNYSEQARLLCDQENGNNYPKDETVWVYISGLSARMLGAWVGSSTMADVIEERDELANVLGQ